MAVAGSSQGTTFDPPLYYAVNPLPIGDSLYRFEQQVFNRSDLTSPTRHRVAIAIKRIILTHLRHLYIYLILHILNSN